MEINGSGSQRSQKAQEDLLLVEKAIAGDQMAFAELMARYRTAIYYVMLKLAKGNKADADDLTIEAFGKVFKKIHQYSPAYAFSTWLFKIATNNAIDYIRRKRRSLLVEIEQYDDANPMMSIIEEELDPADALIKAQISGLVREVVQNLKPRYRRLVELRYFQELTYEEIAEQLELPLGTVKAQLFRARELLYNILKNTETAKDRLHRKDDDDE